MGEKVKITTGDLELTGTLDDTPAARQVAENLPAEGLVQTMGREIYFFVNFTVDAEELSDDAPGGSIAYWPPGSALCLFFGQRPVSPVAIVGKLDGEPSKLADALSGELIRVEKA